MALPTLSEESPTDELIKKFSGMNVQVQGEGGGVEFELIISLNGKKYYSLNNMTNAYNKTIKEENQKQKQIRKILSNKSFMKFIDIVANFYKIEADDVIVEIGKVQKQYYTLYPDVVLYAANWMSKIFQLNCIESLIKLKESNKNIIQKMKESLEKLQMSSSVKRIKSDSIENIEV